GTPARADLLADVEHRRFVALAFADHDGAADVDVVERLPHRGDGGLVCGVLVAAPHPAGAREAGGFGNADEIEANVAIHRSLAGGGNAELGRVDLFPIRESFLPAEESNPARGLGLRVDVLDVGAAPDAAGEVGLLVHDEGAGRAGELHLSLRAGPDD